MDDEIKLTDNINEAHALLALQSKLKKNPRIQVAARSHGIPIYVTKDKGFEDVKPVISALRSKGVTLIGAAGFCWGRVVVVKLARTDEIQAAVVLHPGRITEDEIKELESFDFLRLHFYLIFQIDSFVKIFPGVSHGWSVRYDLGNESAVKSAEESHGDMLSWFKKYFK
ncbi:hypothetical protein HYC85_009563 [Camellia sinensis]|uniref:Phosphotyrosine protein phosphatase domain-containing protein n=1 Tax=Camellia sinensis TaxID=4442 RepID=A0A7J7HFY9_CAMSI|nr:hypothetical protein HYC85_009563 [Camellia sinensis]